MERRAQKCPKQQMLAGDAALTEVAGPPELSCGPQGPCVSSSGSVAVFVGPVDLVEVFDVFDLRARAAMNDRLGLAGFRWCCRRS